MRTYRLGDRAFNVPSGENESDIVSGINYLANRNGGPASFANDATGEGVVALDSNGKALRRGDRDVKYSWEQLRQLGALAKAARGQGWPQTRIGMEITWDDKPSEKANLPPSWLAAQHKFRSGDGSDAIIDPRDWELEKDADEFSRKAQRAANRDPRFKATLADAIDRAKRTGEPQPIEILLITEGAPTNARGLVLGYYGIRVRGMLIVKDGRYLIVGRGTVEDAGKFNYDLDNLDQRSWLGKLLLIAARGVPDPTAMPPPLAALLPFPLNRMRVPMAFPGKDYSIRANRQANVRIWGTIGN